MKSPPTTRTPVAPGSKARILVVTQDNGLHARVSAALGDTAELESIGSTEAWSKGPMPAAVIVGASSSSGVGNRLVADLSQRLPSVPILLISPQDESLHALRAIKTGASGYLMDSPELSDLPNAIRKLLRGELFLSTRLSERLVIQAIHSTEPDPDSPVDRLSDRELEVLELLGRGLGTKAIASELHLSVKTIETHRAHIKEKLGLASSGEMVRFAVEWVAAQTNSSAPALPLRS
ncbi:MAG: response regulator transcription factor [Terrimicrobiaceae bacterium]|nr:response regulator transcription factor [Terrimicrobiaceae bacterium]